MPTFWSRRLASKLPHSRWFDRWIPLLWYRGDWAGAERAKVLMAKKRPRSSQRGAAWNNVVRLGTSHGLEVTMPWASDRAQRQPALRARLVDGACPMWSVTSNVKDGFSRLARALQRAHRLAEADTVSRKKDTFSAVLRSGSSGVLLTGGSPAVTGPCGFRQWRPNLRGRSAGPSFSTL